MKSLYCRDVQNVARFTQGVNVLRNRGAAEASWMLVEGPPGLGKTNTLEWFSVQEDAPLVRCKAGWTVPWCLRDIAVSLDLEPKASAKKNFDLIVGELVNRNTTLIVDEVNHAAKTLKVLETLRDLTDMTQTVLIIGGHSGTSSALKAHKQIYDRISHIVEFAVATEKDVRHLCDALCEIKVDDDAVREILRQSGGVHRNILNAIAHVEAIGKRAKVEQVGMDTIGKQRLTNDGRARGMAR